MRVSAGEAFTPFQRDDIAKGVRNAEKLSGEPGLGSEPSFVSLVRSSSDVTASLTARLSRSTTSAGRPAGPMTPYQVVD